jgi:hypothetical protein
VTGDRAGVTKWRRSRIYTRATVPDSSQSPRLRARERGRARRRLRYLRQLRELQLRDAGGFVFDLYRFGEQRDAIVRAKLDAMIATDKEIRSLEARLGVAGRVREIRRPGVGGTCPNCGAFHASEASFCADCGLDLKAGGAPEQRVVVAAQAESPGEVTAVELAGDEPSPTAAPAPNGALPAADGDQPMVEWPGSEPVAGANGEPPAPDEIDPDTGEVAAVGPPERPRARRSRARRRRGTER